MFDENFAANLSQACSWLHLLAIKIRRGRPGLWSRNGLRRARAAPGDVRGGRRRRTYAGRPGSFLLRSFTELNLGDANIRGRLNIRASLRSFICDFARPVCRAFRCRGGGAPATFWRRSKSPQDRGAPWRRPRARRRKTYAEATGIVPRPAAGSVPGSANVAVDEPLQLFWYIAHGHNAFGIGIYAEQGLKRCRRQ